MRTLDLSPFIHSAIGFDNLFDFNGLTGLEPSRNKDRALGSFATKAQSFPPYNIEKLNDDDYLITMALAGFGEDELSITVEDDTLTIVGRTTEQLEEQEKNYIHKGIAKRAFERQFQLADSIKVTDASFDNGLLNVSLKREVPEHKKPRTVEISKGSSKKIDYKTA